MEVGLKLEETEEDIDKKEYQAIIGKLLYLAICSRPDIATAVGVVAGMTTHPSKLHRLQRRELGRYLKGTVDVGLRLGSKGLLRKDTPMPVMAML